MVELSTIDWNGLLNPRVIFLDEFRVMISTRDAGTDAPRLIVLNTLVTQDDQRRLRRLGIPPQYRNGLVLIHVDQERPLGTLNRDGPLIADPTQAIFVVGIPELRHLLVVRMRTLIKRVCSTCTDVNIPWDEWGRGAVLMETPLSFTYSPPVHIHGTHVIVVKTPSWLGLKDYNRICTFDFGQRGYDRLPLCDEDGIGAERRALFGDGHKFALNESESVAWWGLMGSLGDGSLFRPVSYFSCSYINRVAA